ncbi:MAG: hypothetical protein P1V81_16070 [Planctomycetota bacterium]|nr:hypothetical protein [Planctomycetota bacterium]
MRLFTALVALLLATACNVVSSVEPLGSSPVTLDPAEWNGTWLYSEGTATIKVVSPREGRLSMVSIDESNDSLEPIVSEVLVLQHGGWTFANLRHEDEPEQNYWLRLHRDGNQLIAWMPAPKAFATSVLAGSLPGRVEEDGNVRLGELTTAHLDHIIAGERELMLLWEEPLAFLRISDKTGI